MSNKWKLFRVYFIYLHIYFRPGRPGAAGLLDPTKISWKLVSGWAKFWEILAHSVRYVWKLCNHYVRSPPEVQFEVLGKLIFCEHKFIISQIVRFVKLPIICWMIICQITIFLDLNVRGWHRQAVLRWRKAWVVLGNPALKYSVKPQWLRRWQ